METHKLRYFTTIAETGSLTRAASLLGVSHSGLSKAVSSLEQETRLKLFRPEGRGLAITAEGKWFYLKAREILKIADEITLRQPAQKPTLRVGVSTIIGYYFAGALAQELGGPLSFDELDVGELEPRILAGDLEFALAFVPSPQPGLEYLTLGEVRFNAYAHEKLLREEADPPYVVPISEYPANPLGYRNRDGWPSDLPRRASFAVRHFAMAMSLVRGAQAALYMPDFAAAQEKGLVPVKHHAAAETRRKVFLVKKQEAEESREMKKAAKVVRGLIR